MTREEYLSQLRNNIQALTLDEQSEAIKYYSDYFEEANDDEKVMKELGTPEELAKTVVENFSNVPVKKQTESRDENTSEKTDYSYSYDSDALYFEYNASRVKNLTVCLKAADTVIVSGNNFAVETRGLTRDSFECSLKKDGTLIISNNGHLNLGFFNHHGKNRIIPKILITIPYNARLNNLTISADAGNCRSKDINIICQTGLIDVGAGNLNLKSVYGGKLDFRCGMGNLSFDGSVSGISNIDCGMGHISMTLKGDSSAYSNDTKVGLGQICINEIKKSGICQDFNQERKQNHLSINCGIGAVNIKINQ